MAFFAAAQDSGALAPTGGAGEAVDWAEDVSQGVCRPGCTSDQWIAHGGTWCPSAILRQAAATHFVQVPPAKPGTILLGGEGEWQNTTIFHKECMVRAAGTSEDAGTVRCSDGHYYWKVVRSWTLCEIGDPTRVGGPDAAPFVKMPFEQVVASDGGCMLDASRRCFSLVRWVRRAEDGVVCIFENDPSASPEVGWDFGSNPARLLAVSQAEPLPGQHPALSSEHHQHQPPAPPGLPPVV